MLLLLLLGSTSNFQKAYVVSDCIGMTFGVIVLRIGWQDRFSIWSHTFWRWRPWRHFT